MAAFSTLALIGAGIAAGKAIKGAIGRKPATQPDTQATVGSPTPPPTPNPYPFAIEAAMRQRTPLSAASSKIRTRQAAGTPLAAKVTNKPGLTQAGTTPTRQIVGSSAGLY